MALIRTNRVSAQNAGFTGSAVTIVTGSFTPSDNSLLVVIASVQDVNYSAASPSSLTISNTGPALTWTSRLLGDPANTTEVYVAHARIWTAPITTGAPMTVTIGNPGWPNGRGGATVVVVDYTGYDHISPIGATAGPTDTPTTGGTPGSITLSGAPATTSEVIAAITSGIGSTGSVHSVEGSGWTELYDLSNDGGQAMQVQARAGSTSTTVAWADVNNGSDVTWNQFGIAVEIKAFNDPLDITGCQLWLDADDGSSFTLSGALVQQWNDKSGSGNHFVKGAHNNPPDRVASTLNGKAGVVWTLGEGLSCSTALALSQPHTIFLVMLDKVLDGNIHNYIGKNGGVFYHPGTAGFWVQYGGSSFPSNSYAIVADTPYYHTVVVNGASTIGRRNGVTVLSGVNPGTAAMDSTIGLGFLVGVGQTVPTGSYFCEVIVYNRALTAGEIVDVEQYLNQKWFVSAGTNITGTPATVTVTAGNGQIQLPAAITGTPATVTVTAGSGQIQLPAAITGTPATVTVTAGSTTVTGHAAIIGTSAAVTVTAGSAAITATTTVTGTSATVTVTAGSGVVGINAPDPVKIADRGIRTSTATGNGTITITNPTLITVGNYLVARVAVDNSGASGARPGLVFSDTRNGTWSQGTGGLQDPGAVSAGVAVYLCYVKVAVAYQAGDVFSFAWTTGTPISSIVVEEWANIRQTTPLSVAEVSANNLSSTAQPSISRTPLAVGELVYVAAALEGFSSYWGAQDTDTTGGSWGDVTKAEANTGSAVTSVSVYGGYKIVTSTAAQTWNNTIGTASDWASVAVVFAKNIPPTNVTGIPGWVTVTAGSAVVAGNAAVIGTSAIVSVQAGSGVLTAGTNVTGTSATVSVQAGTGVIQFPTTNITGTSATVVVTAGTGTITGQTNITGTPATVVVTASTATITGQTNITGTSATVTVTAGTGNIASQINITGTSATVVVTSGTGIVGTILTIVGTSATVVATAGTGIVTGHASVTGTSAIVVVTAGSAVLIGSVIGTSAIVAVTAGTGIITAQTAITGTPATVAITAGTAPILTGANILGTSARVSVVAGIGIITAQTNIIALSAIISVIAGTGTISGQANTTGTSAVIAIIAGTGQITAAGSYVLPAKQGAILVV